MSQLIHSTPIYDAIVQVTGIDPTVVRSLPISRKPSPVDLAKRVRARKLRAVKSL